MGLIAISRVGGAVAFGPWFEVGICDTRGLLLLSRACRRGKLFDELIPWHDFHPRIDPVGFFSGVKNDLASGFEVGTSDVKAFTRHGVADRAFDFYRSNAFGAEFEHEVNFRTSGCSIKP